MKKITFLLLSFLGVLSMANAQDITVFDFETINPTFTGDDNLQLIANPAVNASNNSATVGQLTHLAQWGDKNTVVNIDPRVYNTIEMWVYVPTSVTGKVTIACFNGATQLDWYETAAITTAGVWTKVTRPISFTKKITSVKVGWNRNNVISSTATDNVVLIDNLVFKKTSSEYITLFNETFYASWSQWGDWKGKPSTKAGSWFGGVNIQTETDTYVNIKRDWNNNVHDFNLQVRKDSASVIIPNIDATGFDNLKLSIDLAWPYSAGENSAFYSVSAAQKSPLIQFKSGNGNWIDLTTTPIAQAWGTQVFVLTDAQGSPVNGTSPISIRLFNTSALTVSYDEIKLLGKIPSISTAVTNNATTGIAVYPNPATDYIVAKGAKSVTVCTPDGKQLLFTKNTERVNISMLSKGLYIVAANDGTTNSIIKLIKK